MRVDSGVSRNVKTDGAEPVADQPKADNPVKTRKASRRTARPSCKVCGKTFRGKVGFQYHQSWAATAKSHQSAS